MDGSKMILFFNIAVISSFGKSVNELLDKKKYSKRLINIINSSILNLVPDLNRVSHQRLLMIFTPNIFINESC